MGTEPDRLRGKSTAELIDRLRSELRAGNHRRSPGAVDDGASTPTEFADAVVLVMSIGETSWRDLRRAAENLRAIGRADRAVLICKYHRRMRIRWIQSFRNFWIRNREAGAMGSLSIAETSRSNGRTQ